MPSIQTNISSQNIHEDPKASSQFPEESRSEDVSIHRRHSSDSRHKGKSQATATPSEFNPNSPRVRSKYKEVHTRTHSTNRVSGYDDRLEGNENLSTKGKDRVNQKRMQVCPAPVRQMSYLIGLLISSHPAVHSAPLHIRALQRAKIQALRHGSYNSVVTMELDQRKDLQWWIQQLEAAHGRPIVPTYPQIALTSDASKTGWGASCVPQRTGGKMDTGGIRSTYQCIGTYSSLVCPEELREFGIRQARSDPNGQSNCGDLLEQDGRYPCKGPVRLSPANMAVESGKEHSNISRILTRERKCDSRSGVTPSQRCQRLETRHTDIQSPSTEMGTIQCRSFCSATQ